MRRIILSSVAGVYHIFPHNLINGRILGKQLLNVKCHETKSLVARLKPLTLSCWCQGSCDNAATDSSQTHVPTWTGGRDMTRKFIADLRPGCIGRPARVGFVVNGVALGQVSFGVLQFSYVGIIQPLPRTRSPLTDASS